MLVRPTHILAAVDDAIKRARHTAKFTKDLVSSCEAFRLWLVISRNEPVGRFEVMRGASGRLKRVSEISERFECDCCFRAERQRKERRGSLLEQLGLKDANSDPAFC